MIGDNSSKWKELLISVVMVLAPVCIGWIFEQQDLQETNIVLIYLLCSVLTARMTNGMGWCLGVTIISIFTLNYFFMYPRFVLSLYNPYYAITYLILFLVTMLVSAITIWARKAQARAERREEEANILYKLASDLSSLDSYQEIILKGIRCVHNTFQVPCCYIPIAENGLIKASYLLVDQSGQLITKRTIKVRNINETDRKLEQGILVGNVYYEWPIQGFKGLHGYIGIPIEQAEKFKKPELSFIFIIVDTVSIALGRLINLEAEQRVKQEAQEERYKGNLLRSISHDIRNPLTGIMGTAQLIMDQNPSSSSNYELAGSIRQSSSWLLDMVSNILSLTRLQNGSLKLEKEVEIAEDVVIEAIGNIHSRFPERAVDFNPPEEVIAARMDPKLIQQVIINLIDNAFKHTPEDKRVWVELFRGPKKGWVSIAVHDEGSGLSREDLKNLFALFYTTRSKEDGGRKGYGLGLPICDSIMKAHGGTISAANNTNGKGAVFTISFPDEMESV